MTVAGFDMYEETSCTCMLELVTGNNVFVTRVITFNFVLVSHKVTVLVKLYIVFISFLIFLYFSLRPYALDYLQVTVLWLTRVYLQVTVLWLTRVISPGNRVVVDESLSPGNRVG